MKQPPAGTEERIAAMRVASIYPLYLAKVEKKGRTQAELDQVIEWLTGYSATELQEMLETELCFDQFFADCNLNPKARLIRGMICGYRVEEIENPLIQQMRYLDKLVDELAKGKAMAKLLRS